MQSRINKKPDRIQQFTASQFYSNSSVCTPLDSKSNIKSSFTVAFYYPSTIVHVQTESRYFAFLVLPFSAPMKMLKALFCSQRKHSSWTVCKKPKGSNAAIEDSHIDRSIFFFKPFSLISSRGTKASCLKHLPTLTFYTRSKLTSQSSSFYT